VAAALLSLAGLLAGVLPLRLYPLLAFLFGGFWNRISLGIPEPATKAALSKEEPESKSANPSNPSR
jgi:hypothetical protein